MRMPGWMRYNTTCNADSICPGFVAYTQYIRASYPEYRKIIRYHISNLEKLTILFESLTVEKLMQYFKGPDLAHSLHMQPVIADQAIQD